MGESRRGQEWLQHFPAGGRGAVNNWFLRFIREGCDEPARICSHVIGLMADQAAFDGEGSGVQRMTVVRWMADDPAGALALARYALWFESLPPADKAKERARRQQAANV